MCIYRYTHLYTLVQPYLSINVPSQCSALPIYMYIYNSIYVSVNIYTFTLAQTYPPIKAPYISIDMGWFW